MPLLALLLGLCALLQEQKKKELEDLDAVLAELGLEAKPEAEVAADADLVTAASSKAAKRKAKKAQQTNGEAATNGSGATSADSSAENKVGRRPCGVQRRPALPSARLCATHTLSTCAGVSLT